MKISKWFEMKNPTYVFLKLTPTKSTRNQNTDKIAKVIASLYKTITQQIYRYEKKFFYECPSKVSYYIYLEKSRAEFYFVVPEPHLQLIKEKIGDCWKGITVQRVEYIPIFSKESTQYYMTYKKEDALSIAVDKRSNTLLSSTLNVLSVMEEGDKVGIFSNFVPCNQYSWRSEYDNTIKKVHEGLPVDREKFNGLYIFKMTLVILSEIADMITEVISDLAGESNIKEALNLKFHKLELSQSTKTKKNELILNTQLLVLSESENKGRANNNAIALCQAYKSKNEDNELVYKRIYRTRELEPTNLYLPGVDRNKMSTDECHNFIALPGKELLEEHKCIEKIETQETQVPRELRTGIMCIGENVYRGTKQKAYLTSDREYKNLALTIIGPTRAGKTTLIENLANDSIKNNECTILFDFCGNCELSDEVSETIKAKVLNIDCSIADKLQGLGYNEIKNSSSVFEKYRNAKIQTSQLLTLVDSINADDKALSAKMNRYLESAALVVFISNGPIKDVFGALQNHIVRYKYIEKIPKNQLENLEEYILSLKEIDDKDKSGTIIGTRLTAVAGIIDRINKLKQNVYMELMLKQDCKNNIDLVDEIQKPQLICLRMPEIMFSTETEKDIYCTYWITKIWLALQIRKWTIKDRSKHVKVNIVVDELYQVPHTQDFIRSKLSQMAKFSAKMIISCHYLGQISIIRNELKAANSSYMLISGCDKDNWKELKDELYPYTVEDIINLQRYNSLNLIKYEKGFARFITKLPKPVS